MRFAAVAAVVDFMRPVLVSDELNFYGATVTLAKESKSEQLEFMTSLRKTCANSTRERRRITGSIFTPTVRRQVTEPMALSQRINLTSYL